MLYNLRGKGSIAFGIKKIQGANIAYGLICFTHVSEKGIEDSNLSSLSVSSITVWVVLLLTLYFHTLGCSLALEPFSEHFSM